MPPRIPGNVYISSDLSTDLGNSEPVINIKNNLILDFPVITSQVPTQIVAPNGPVTITYSPIL